MHSVFLFLHCSSFLFHLGFFLIDSAHVYMKQNSGKFQKDFKILKNKKAHYAHILMVNINNIYFMYSCGTYILSENYGSAVKNPSIRALK